MSAIKTFLSIAEAHQTPRRRRRDKTRPSVVLTVPCSTDATAACSSVHVHR